MKRFFSILLCLVMSFGFSLTAFAGGPITAEDILSVENTDITVMPMELPSELSAGTVYKIKSMDNSVSGSFMLNVNGGKDSNGAKINMWRQEDGSEEQKFRLVASGNYYKLKAVCASGRYLDAYRNNDKIEDGCTVDIWDDSDNPAQQLVITGNSTYGYTIFLTGSASLVLTATGMYNGAGVQFQKLTSNKNQRWNFISTDDTPTLLQPDSKAQNKSLWCWAAAAKMVAEHNSGGLNPKISTSPQRLDNELGFRINYCSMDSSGYLTVDGAQHSIVTHVKGGSDANSSADNTEIREALKYATGIDNIDTTKVGNYERKLSGPEIEQIISELKSGRYVIGGMGEKNSNKDFESLLGHVVVITDYDETNNKFRIFDPWNKNNFYHSPDDIFVNENYNVAGINLRIEWFFYCRDLEGAF